MKRRGHKLRTVISCSCCLQTKHQLLKKVRKEGVSLLACSFVACLLAGSLEQQEYKCDGIQWGGGKHQQFPVEFGCTKEFGPPLMMCPFFFTAVFPIPHISGKHGAISSPCSTYFTENCIIRKVYNSTLMKVTHFGSSAPVSLFV